MINLLPPALKESRKYGRRNRSLFGYSIALIATAVATAIIMIVGIQFIASEEPSYKSTLEDVQAEITKLEGEIAGIENVALRVDTAKAIDDSSVKFSELIPQIAALLPDGVVLNALSLSGGVTDPLQLDVNLLTADLAPITIRNLVDSDLFEAADIAVLTPLGIDTEESETSSYQFNASLSASFTGTAEAARKAAAAEAAKKAAADAAAAEQKGAQ
jgi:Tfp pilus assembly protein PilN